MSYSRALNKRIILFVAIFFFLMTSINIGTATTILTSCDYPHINIPDTYVLANNVLTNYSFPWCFVINTSNVVLDCQGFEIKGRGGGTAIDLNGAYGSKSNITIKNCIINNVSYGIAFGGYGNRSLSNSVIDNNVIMNMRVNYPLIAAAIALNNTINVSIIRNHISHSELGVETCLSNGLRVDSNIVTDSGYGFGIGAGNNIIFNNNTVISTSAHDIDFYDAGAPLFCGSVMKNVTVSNNRAINGSYYNFHFAYDTEGDFFVVNNTVIGNNGTGFMVSGGSSKNMTFINNTAINRSTGFDLSSFPLYRGNFIVINNTVINGTTGFLINSLFGSFIGNKISNFYKGLEIRYDNNSFDGNILSNNEIGIFIWAVNNTVTGNTITNNRVGLQISNSTKTAITKNTITGNTITGNSIGINVTSGFNKIFNNFLNNTINANGSSFNYWNITKTLGTNIIGGPYLGGNYWNDYTGSDTDEDGLGDTKIPYNSSGNITNGDYLPLTTVNIADIIPPVISIISPQNKTYTTTSVPLTFTINEPASWCGYSLDGNVTIPSCANSTLEDLTNGGHNVIIYANDTSGNMNSSRVYFTVLIKPDLVIGFIWNSGNTIYYRIKNQGSAMAGYSYSRLYVDDSYKANDYVASLAVGAYSNENFNYTWTCSDINDTIKVCADANNNVDEINENNNCLEIKLECIKTCQAKDGRCMSGSGGCIAYCKRLGKWGYCELADPRFGYYPGCSPGNCCCLCD